MRSAVLYVDILFFINFCMDAVSLLLMLKLSSKKSSFKRVILSSCIGAVYSVVDTALSFGRILSFGLSVSVSFLMVRICVGRRFKALFYVKYTAVLWACAALLAGCATFICSLGAGATPVNSKEKSALFVLTVSVMCVVFAVRAYIRIPRCKNVDAVFRVGTYERRAVAMVDTGNMACDPISGRPVVFLRYNPKLDGRFSSLLSGVGCVPSLDGELKKLIRILPVKRAGSNVMLCGVVCSVICSDKTTGAVLVFENTKSYGGAEALVPPCVI